MIREPGPTLIESAKWIAAFRGKSVVVKLGGELLLNPGTIDRLARQITTLQQCGINVVVIHGAGKQIDEASQKANLKINKVNGRRITDAATRDVIKSVLDQVNQTLVQKLNENGIQAQGANSFIDWPILCQKRPPIKQPNGEEVDFGYVGDVTDVNLTQSSSTIVLPSYGFHPDLAHLNINADTLATSVAIAIKAEKLVFLTGVPGVMHSLNDAGPISTMTTKEAKELHASPSVQGGMKAKLEEALRALENNVPKIHIISGKEPHTLLREVFTDEGCGTLISQ